jgi:carbonic anhydrase
VPNVITNSGPGDLFTVRNVGNLVPAVGDTSVNAALVFALEQLNVRSIVVCGHSSCGAMKAMHSGAETSPGIDAWLAHAQPSLRRLRLGHPVAVAAKTAGFGEVDQLSMVNVAVQLKTLHHHPIVRRAVATRGVTVSGLFFDIATARVIEITADGLALRRRRAAQHSRTRLIRRQNPPAAVWFCHTSGHAPTAFRCVTPASLFRRCPTTSCMSGTACPETTQ